MIGPLRMWLRVQMLFRATAKKIHGDEDGQIGPLTLENNRSLFRGGGSSVGEPVGSIQPLST